jgi:hypothetical protein
MTVNETMRALIAAIDAEGLAQAERVRATANNQAAYSRMQAAEKAHCEARLARRDMDETYLKCSGIWIDGMFT